MDRAVDGNGTDVRSWDFTHAEAKAQCFFCYDCKVPLDVVRMPNYSPPPGGGRPSEMASEIYFRKRRTDPHLDDCWIRQDEVAAIIEKRVVKSRSGRSGAPPSAIVFDREEIRAAQAGSDGENADPGLVKRYRHVPGDDEPPRRGDRKSVSGTIERACRLHLGRQVDFDDPLTVQYLPRGVRTYGDVFQRAENARPDMKRIWFAKLRYMIAPVVGGKTLRLATFDREFLVDRSGWRPSVISEFDDELAVCLDHVRKEWPSANGMIDPFVYALGEMERLDGSVVVRDHRMVCIAVRDLR